MLCVTCCGAAQRLLCMLCRVTCFVLDTVPWNIKGNVHVLINFVCFRWEAWSHLLVVLPGNEDKIRIAFIIDSRSILSAANDSK